MLSGLNSWWVTTYGPMHEQSYGPYQYKWIAWLRGLFVPNLKRAAQQEKE